MWIMLTTKLPTNVSPPIGSIHWAGANAADVTRQYDQHIRSMDWKDALVADQPVHEYWKTNSLIDEGDRYFDSITHFGYEPKEEGSVWIIFDALPIKVWPHEYTELDDDKLDIYIMGVNGDDWTMSHFPMYGRVPLIADPDSLTVNDLLSEYPRFNRDVYDAAQVDGQNALQAFYTAVGGYPYDIWFSMGRHYYKLYGCTEWEVRPTYRKGNEIYDLIKSGWNEVSK